jgi:hypothetical protein
VRSLRHGGVDWQVDVKEEPEDHEDEEREFATLDFSRFQFPSDRLTVLNLRQLHPELFDRGFKRDGMEQPQYFFRADVIDHAAGGIGFMLFRERLIATAAYAGARGLTSPVGWNIEEEKQGLIESYCTHRLATGAHEAAEMVRSIERQGTELAQQSGIARSPLPPPQ